MNPALFPVPGFEPDFYDWRARHAAKCAAARSRSHPLILVGDSITHLLEGDPAFPGRFGAPFWDRLFAGRTLNLGYGYDRTQNALWRLDHGELEGQTPELVVVMIGTNNIGDNGSVPACAPADTAEGIAAVCDLVHCRCPAARVLLMGLLPRGPAGGHLRERVAAVNRIIAGLPASRPWLGYRDIGAAYLAEDGSIPLHLMEDGVHPSTAGYRVWLDALMPHLRATAAFRTWLPESAIAGGRAGA